MRAVTWQGRRNVRVDQVPDPGIEQPDDIVGKVTTTGLCGSDLHLYEVFRPYLDPGDILGHETIRPHLADEDPLGVDGFATRRLSLEEVPAAYAIFQAKEGGMVKTLLKP
ncbi:alcohol dehydrogenase catalytic domain-containing protein [Streptomyces sp. SID5785]|nr:alcohol dehydrogenase catalytic domain-containing protein [Streptomyces sp. SID5785]